MVNFLRRYLDELLTGSFLFLIFLLVPFHPPVFATPGGRTLAHWVLRTAFLLLALLLAAARFSSRARSLLRIVLEVAPVIVAVLGYVSLKLMHASVLTAWLGIQPRDHWMLAADNILFGKTPYLWFAQWGLDSHLFLQVMACFYGFYPFMPILAVIWFLYRGDTAQLRLVRRTIILSLFAGYSCYILIPVAGPLAISTQAAPIFIQSTLTYTFLMGNFRYAFDCFPSLHTANPWLLVWICRGKFPRWFMAIAITICSCITLSTIALRMHYGIDDIAGLVWIFPIAYLARKTLPRAAAQSAPNSPSTSTAAPPVVEFGRIGRRAIMPANQNLERNS
jgi:membrane-associated phospholipid phosphatase